MAHIDCIKVHNERSGNGDAYIVDNGSDKSYMIKQYDPNTGAEIAPLEHAKFDEQCLVDEIARLQAQVDEVTAFKEQQYPS